MCAYSNRGGDSVDFFFCEVLYCFSYFFFWIDVEEIVFQLSDFHVGEPEEGIDVGYVFDFLVFLVAISH